MNIGNTSDPTIHTARVKEQLHGLITHLRGDIPQLADPKAKALFEATAEVLTGLERAFRDYEEKKEPAWQ
jgi:hypothetical protein